MVGGGFERDFCWKYPDVGGGGWGFEKDLSWKYTGLCGEWCLEEGLSRKYLDMGGGGGVGS